MPWQGTASARRRRICGCARALSAWGFSCVWTRVLWRECSYFSSTSAARFKNVTVLGGGLMGNGITQVTAAAGYNVTMVRHARVHPPAAAPALRACSPLQAGLRAQRTLFHARRARAGTQVDVTQELLDKSTANIEKTILRGYKKAIESGKMDEVSRTARQTTAQRREAGQTESDRRTELERAVSQTG